MPRHEIPTHLDVQDKVLFGLTARQAMHVLIGLAAAYALWTHLTAAGLPAGAAITAAGGCLGVAVLAALVRPRGRPVEEWAVVLARYAATPRVFVWRPVLPPAAWRAEQASSLLNGRRGWAELVPPLGSPHDGTGAHPARSTSTVGGEVAP